MFGGYLSQCGTRLCLDNTTIQYINCLEMAVNDGKFDYGIKWITVRKDGSKMSLNEL